MRKKEKTYHPRSDHKVLFFVFFLEKRESPYITSKVFFDKMESPKKKSRIIKFYFFFVEIFCLKNPFVLLSKVEKKSLKVSGQLFFFESAGHLHSTPAFGSRSVPVPRAFEKKGAWVLKIKNRFCFSKLFFKFRTFEKKLLKKN